MALRFVLVGLVASLGFEMPTVQDVTSWAQDGRSWAEARLADVSSLRVEAARAFSGPSACERADEPAPATAVVPSTRGDLTFEAVVDGMAKDFTADLASIEEASPAEELIAAVEPARESPAAVPTASQPPIPAIETITDEPILAPVPSTSRVDKIATAVRLTRQAMSAWAALIQPSKVDVDDDQDEAP